MGSFEQLINKISNRGVAVAAVFLSAIALLITTSVICRAIHISLPGTFDLVETLVVVAIAFALVYGQLEDRHLRADIAIERLKGRVRSSSRELSWSPQSCLLGHASLCGRCHDVAQMGDRGDDGRP